MQCYHWLLLCLQNRYCLLKKKPMENLFLHENFFKLEMFRNSCLHFVMYIIRKNTDLSSVKPFLLRFSAKYKKEEAQVFFSIIMITLFKTRKLCLDIHLLKQPLCFYIKLITYCTECDFMTFKYRRSVPRANRVSFNSVNAVTVFHFTFFEKRLRDKIKEELSI